MEESERLKKKGEEGILLPHAHAHFSLTITATNASKMDIFAIGGGGAEAAHLKPK